MIRDFEDSWSQGMLFPDFKRPRILAVSEPLQKDDNTITASKLLYTCNHGHIKRDMWGGVSAVSLVTKIPEGRKHLIV